MKLKSFFVLGSTLLFLTACSNEDTTSTYEQNQENVADSSNEENTLHGDSVLDLSNSEAGWINFSGEHAGSIDYKVSPEIDYESDENYVLNIDAYVSYFSNGEFIETLLTSKGNIENVENADAIRVSYHKSFEDRLTLVKE